jgi:hypothetical protein
VVQFDKEALRKKRLLRMTYGRKTANQNAPGAPIPEGMEPEKEGFKLYLEADPCDVVVR